MYLSRIRPTERIDQMRRLAHIAGGSQYRIHTALWHLFEYDPDAKRDFLYRQDGQADKLSFLVLSKRRPGTDKGLWDVQIKEFAPRLRVGQRLNFSIRINPVIKRRDEEGRQQRHDLVMDLKKNTNGHVQTQAELVQQAAHKWLANRAASNGFELIDSSLIGEAYRQWRFSGKGGRNISFSSIDCAGVLTVTDTELFEQAIHSGIGPVKAFGCGLLLIRPT